MRYKSLRSYLFILVAFLSTTLLGYPANIGAQNQWLDQIRSLPKGAGPPADFKHILKKPGHYTIEDWRAVIDSTWGEGLPTADKLQIFDIFWETIDEEYAGFHNLYIDWDSLKNEYRPEVEAGVSRGRFYGILGHLQLALMEMHTRIVDVDVFLDTLELGLPLMVVGGWSEVGHFGAALTPLPDSSLLIYNVVENHPLGLVLGDIILGYDGIPWKDLYLELLDAQLPITSFSKRGSSERSFAHSMLISAGLNWHLFDTLDVVKYETGDTLHLATNTLVGQEMQLYGLEQMPIPGVPWPDWDNNHFVSWGIIEGTQIGYIYGMTWGEGTEPDFTNAVNTLLNDYETTGLIIDFRIQSGGHMARANGGFSRLFNFDLQALEIAIRSDPDDHFAMTTVTEGSCTGQAFRFQADNYLYDRPIAVLTGPHCGSAGDYNAMRIKFHPMARFFGKPTNTGYVCFTQFQNISIPYSGWVGQFAPRNVFLADNPGNYLMHVGFEVDEDVWLTQEDVVKGEDTVVKRAIEWIQNLAYAHDVTIDPAYIAPGIDEATITAHVENPNDHTLSVVAKIIGSDSAVVDSITLFDDGIHNDGAAEDDLWGNSWSITSEEETTYSMNVTTVDSTAGTQRILPNIAHFTTIGPVSLAEYSLPVHDPPYRPGDDLYVQFTLTNRGATAEAMDVSIEITPEHDSLITNIGYPFMPFGNIAAGDTSGVAFYNINVSENYPGDTDALFVLSIASEGYPFWSDSISIHIDHPVEVADEKGALPAELALHQSYPNPFNPVSTIRYDLPKGSNVSMIVYDILGREVARLVDGYKEPGYHQTMWDSRDSHGRELPSGIYIARLTTPEYSKAVKMVLLK